VSSSGRVGGPNTTDSISTLTRNWSDRLNRSGSMGGRRATEKPVGRWRAIHSRSDRLKRSETSGTVAGIHSRSSTRQRTPDCDPSPPDCDPSPPDCDPSPPDYDPSPPECDPSSAKHLSPTPSSETRNRQHNIYTWPSLSRPRACGRALDFFKLHLLLSPERNSSIPLGFSRSERKGMRAGQDLLPFLSCLLAMNLTVDLCSDLLLPLAFRDSPNGMRAGSDLTPFSCRPSNLPNQHGYRRDGDGLGAGTGFDPVSSGNSLHSSLLRLPFPSFRCNCQSNTVIAADSDELGAGIGFGPFSFCVFPLMTAADHFRSFNPSILSRHEQALATCDAVIAADSDGLGAGIGFAPFSSCVFPLMTAADHFRSFNPSILFKTPSNCDLRHGYRCGQRWAWGGLRIWPLFLFCHNRSRFSFLRKNLHLAIRLSLRTAMGMGRARICPFPPSASFLMMTADLFSRTSRRRLSTLKTFPVFLSKKADLIPFPLCIPDHC
ncbi:hypothetical protein L249_8616, partial [Ophiocordyceps polyrhachis-furcata BCC 54312]